MFFYRKCTVRHSAHRKPILGIGCGDSIIGYHLPDFLLHSREIHPVYPRAPISLETKISLARVSSLSSNGPYPSFGGLPAFHSVCPKARLDTYLKTKGNCRASGRRGYKVENSRSPIAPLGVSKRPARSPTMNAVSCTQIRSCCCNRQRVKVEDSSGFA